MLYASFWLCQYFWSHFRGLKISITKKHIKNGIKSFNVTKLECIFDHFCDCQEFVQMNEVDVRIRKDTMEIASERERERESDCDGMRLVERK